jgi:hypothetical protein
MVFPEEHHVILKTATISPCHWGDVIPGGYHIFSENGHYFYIVMNLEGPREPMPLATQARVE